MSKDSEFIYVLRLEPRLHDVNNWTEADEKIAEAHFLRLKQFTETGQVILAGRTLNEAEDSFGIVVFKAANEEEAYQFMKGDPAVEQEIMTAELYPYRVALMGSR